MRCWFHPCDAPGRRDRVIYREHGGEIPLTLCDDHARLVSGALADRRARWGVLVTSHNPPRVIVEEPRRRDTRRYRALIVVRAAGSWPTVELRQSAMSRRTVSYAPGAPLVAPLGPDEESASYELLEVSPEEAVGDFGVPWPRSLIIQRRYAGYTDRQVYLPDAYWA